MCRPLGVQFSETKSSGPLSEARIGVAHPPQVMVLTFKLIASLCMEVAFSILGIVIIVRI